MSSKKNKTIVLEKKPSSTLINLIAEANFSLESAREKILKAYNYAIDKDGFTPKEAAKVLRERLDFSDRYIREVLPLEAKDHSKKNLYLNHDAEPVPHNLQDNNENDENISNNEMDIPDEGSAGSGQKLQYQPNDDLEKFRKEKATNTDTDIDTDTAVNDFFNPSQGQQQEPKQEQRSTSEYYDPTNIIQKQTENEYEETIKQLKDVIERQEIKIEKLQAKINNFEVQIFKGAKDAEIGEKILPFFWEFSCRTKKLEVLKLDDKAARKLARGG